MMKLAKTPHDQAEAYRVALEVDEIRLEVNRAQLRQAIAEGKMYRIKEQERLVEVAEKLVAKTKMLLEKAEHEVQESPGQINQEMVEFYLSTSMCIPYYKAWIGTETGSKLEILARFEIAQETAKSLQIAYSGFMKTGLFQELGDDNDRLSLGNFYEMSILSAINEKHRLFLSSQQYVDPKLRNAYLSLDSSSRSLADWMLIAGLSKKYCLGVLFVT
jgi:hypothetical protein